MKQNRHFIFTVAALLFGFSLSAKAEEVATIGGTGTESDPYTIGTLEQLEAFRNSVNAGETTYNAPGVWVALTDDIDLAGTTWERGIGDGINATYDGIFDGKNHTIKNLKMNPTPDEVGYVCGGLFGYTYGAVVIKNLVMENVTIDCADVNRVGNADIEPHNVGALVGFANNKGGSITVDKVTVKGNIKIDAPNVDGVAAIVGYSYLNMGVISNCAVEGASGSYIRGYNFVGGICGYSNVNATISGCSVKNIDITGTNFYTGGIVGIVLANNTVSDCVVENVTVSGEASVGNVIGAISGNGISLTLENCTAAEPLLGGNYDDNKPIVATVGTKYYTSLAEAFAVAKNGETVTLVSDLAIDEGLVIEKGSTVILDLNGHTLSMEVDDRITGHNALILNKGNLTIDDSSAEGTGKLSYNFTGTADNAWSYTVTAITNEQGTLAIEGGTIESLSTATNVYKFTIDNLTNGAAGDAILNVNGGTITAAKGSAIRGFANSTTCNNVIKMTGGRVEGQVWLQDPNKSANKGTMEITGGTVSCSDIDAVYLYGLGDASGMNVIIGGDALVEGNTYLISEYTTEPFEASITGGTFKGDVSVYSYAQSEEGADYVAVPAISGGVFSNPVDESLFVDGFVPVQNPDGSYGASNSITIDDADYKAEGKTYDNFITTLRTVGEITYSRTFGHTGWQVLYVPFAVPYENFKDAFAAYTITGVEDNCVTLTQITEGGVIEANTPCLVKAHATGEVTITVENAAVCAAENKSFSFVDDVYTFTGTYSAMDAAALKSGKCYVLSGGSWQQLAESNTTAVLGAFRVYLTIDSEDTASLARSFSMRVIGGNAGDGATAIEPSPLAPQHEADVIYDLLGRRVTSLTQGIFIVNGKKVVIR